MKKGGEKRQYIKEGKEKDNIQKGKKNQSL
jgi:hypothetical protein